MAEFFYTNINFEEEEPFVYHMNKIPCGLYADPVTSAAKQVAEKFGMGQERRTSGAKARIFVGALRPD
jgi:hypothetical protein